MSKAAYMILGLERVVRVVSESGVLGVVHSRIVACPAEDLRAELNAKGRF
jgi:hypothetical protein